MFKISDTHYAETWLLHPDAPKVEPPASVQRRMRKVDNVYSTPVLAAKDGQ